MRQAETLKHKLWRVVRVEMARQHPSTARSAGGLLESLLALRAGYAEQVFEMVPPGVTPECARELQQFVKAGAYALAKAGGSNDKLQVDQAELSLRRLILTMLVEARAMGQETLHERSFFEAIKKLCPLFPFC